MEPWSIPTEIIQLVSKLSEHHINSLNREFTAEEIRSAVFQMGGLKSPGPDAILVVFYQKAWSIVGEEITEAVIYFFQRGYLLREWNQTFFTLIPKVASPETTSQFRPISLCNVIYKIISKCMTNRLKPIMQEIVGPFQNAFVPKRYMGDNCLLAHEIITYMKRKKKGLVFYFEN